MPQLLRGIGAEGRRSAVLEPENAKAPARLNRTGARHLPLEAALAGQGGLAGRSLGGRFLLVAPREPQRQDEETESRE